MIEHRHTKRVAISSKVSIYHRGNLVADCQIKDISIDGLAIWAGPLQYHRNTMLEVKITNDHQAPSNAVRLPAIVVYSSADILGMMFSKVDEQEQQYIRQSIEDSLAGSRKRKTTVTGGKKSNGWESALGGMPAA